MSEDDVSELEALDVSEDMTGKKVRRKRCSIEVLPSGTVRLRARGTWPDGQPINETAVFAQGPLESRLAAARAAKPAMWRKVEEMEAGIIPRVDPMTLAQAVERLRKSGVYKARKSEFAGPMFRTWQSKDLRAFDDLAWEAWVKRWQKEGKAAATIRNAYSRISAVVGRCVRAKWLAEIPWRDQKRWLPSESETHTRRAMDEHETRALIVAAERIDKEDGGGDLALRIRLQYHLAARPVELARMGPVHLVEEGGVPWMRWQAAKGNGIREYPLSDELAEEVREAWAALPPPAKRCGVFFPLRGHRGVWRLRTRVNADGVETGVVWTESERNRLREITGIQDVVPYFIRHTGATDVADEHKLGAFEVMKLLGHRVVRTTGRYVKPKMAKGTLLNLAKERAASRPTPEPTRSFVVVGPDSPADAKKLETQAVERGPRDEVQAKKPMKSPVKTRGLAVGAEQVERWMTALEVLRGQVRAAGGVKAWVQVTTLDEETLAEIASDLMALTQVATLPEESDAGLIVQLVGAIRSRAHAAQKSSPISGVDSGEKVKKNGHLKLVSGLSFTSNKPERSEE
jgi:integrase